MFEKLFALKKNNTSIKTEIVAGLTTFLTMAYIIFINPNMLSQAGMDYGAVFVATCVAAAIGCFIMGFYANLPIALAPGMGLNAFFTYTIVLGMGYSWQIALGCVFISGIVFILVSLFKLREMVINSIPNGLKKSIGAGIGAFIALIALKNAGIVVSNPNTLVHLGDLKSLPAIMTTIAFLLTISLVYFRVQAAVLLGIFIVTALALIFDDKVVFNGFISTPTSIAPTLMQMDLKGALEPAMFTVIFSLFFVDLFDTAGTLIAVTERAGLAKDGKIPNVKKALLADSTATVIGAMLGTSNTTSYIESASGVGAGGKTGLTAVTVGVLFLLSLFIFPVALMIPGYATHGALIYVAVLMIYALKDVDWQDITEFAPAVITFLMIVLSFSVADGIAIGFISYVFIKIITGQFKTINPGVLLLTALLLLRLIYN